MPVQKMVIDAWPLLEWLQKGVDQVPRFAALLELVIADQVQFCLSRMNYGEVIYTLRKAHGADPVHVQTSIKELQAIPLEIASATDSRVDAAVDLKSRYAISYADAFAAALAIEYSFPLVTGDREFRALERDGLLRLHWVGA